MATLEEFEENLNKIGFSIKGRYPNSWIYKPDNTRTYYRVMSDRIEMCFRDENFISYDACFYFKDSDVELIDGDAVSLGKNGIFAMFYNHPGIKEQKNEIE